MPSSARPVASSTTPSVCCDSARAGFSCTDVRAWRSASSSLSGLEQVDRVVVARARVRRLDAQRLEPQPLVALVDAVARDCLRPERHREQATRDERRLRPAQSRTERVQAEHEQRHDRGERQVHPVLRGHLGDDRQQARRGGEDDEEPRRGERPRTPPHHAENKTPNQAAGELAAASVGVRRGVVLRHPRPLVEPAADRHRGGRGAPDVPAARRGRGAARARPARARCATAPAAGGARRVWHARGAAGAQAIARNRVYESDERLWLETLASNRRTRARTTTTRSTCSRPDGWRRPSATRERPCS